MSTTIPPPVDTAALRQRLYETPASSAIAAVYAMLDRLEWLEKERVPGLIEANNREVEARRAAVRALLECREGGAK